MIKIIDLPNNFPYPNYPYYIEKKTFDSVAPTQRVFLTKNQNFELTKWGI
jgi:hypothetical protein